MRHTPGPYRVGSLVTNEGQVAIMAGDKRVALVDSHADVPHKALHSTPCETRTANANLFAAAPDLLEASKKALAHVEAWQANPSGFDPSACILDLRESIAKAEGRS